MKYRGKSAVLFAYLKLRSSIRIFTGPWFRYEQHSFMQLFLLCYIFIIKKIYWKYKLIISQRVFKICIHASWNFRNSPKIIITVLSCIVILYTPWQTFPVYMMTRIWCWCAEWFYRFRFDDSWDVHSYIYLGRFSFHSRALLIDVSPNRHWILGHVILLYQ